MLKTLEKIMNITMMGALFISHEHILKPEIYIASQLREI